MVSRTASPTRRPVLARRPIRVDSATGRNVPRGGAVAAAATSRAISSGVKR
jgi:hypothetical protein